MLAENEDKILELPFEVILAQITSMPARFCFDETDNKQQFDRLMRIKVPTILLERLQKEFNEST
jgi:hypothetical protein